MNKLDLFIKDKNVEYIAVRVINNTYSKLIANENVNNINIKPTVSRFNNDTDINIDINKLNNLYEIINNINIELNISGLGKVNKIIAKIAKVYKLNLF